MKEDIIAALPEIQIPLLRLETRGQSESFEENATVLRGLQDAPCYVALSYCWGNASVTHPFLCSGQELRVQENMRDVLMQLRQDNWNEWIWMMPSASSRMTM
jgi:hypothetical protein